MAKARHQATVARAYFFFFKTAGTYSDKRLPPAEVGIGFAASIYGIRMYTVVGYTCDPIVFYLRVVFLNKRNKVISEF